MAEVLISSSDLAGDLALLEQNGFLLHTIFPADEPRVAQMRGHGVAIRLDMTAEGASPTVMIADGSTGFVTSAGASFQPGDQHFPLPELDDTFVHTDGGAWGEGRAGMHYRDLIPERHGGRFIASHIRIVEPGPVPDYVHHHDIRFQMIFCRRGRVQVVYEDQGPAFWLAAGDCVLQPPNIRHRVLASEDTCEVVEVSCPAEHPTFIEHDITLPNHQLVPDRDFGGQTFSFDRGDSTSWGQSEFDGWSQRITGIDAATDGFAAVRVLRSDNAETATAVHTDELCLFFVLQGAAELTVDGTTTPLTVDDSVAIAKGQSWGLTAPHETEILHVVVREST